MRRSLAGLLIVALAVLVAKHPVTGSAAFWYRLAEPGPLSAGHRFLATDCLACHVPARGVPAERCVKCHAFEPQLFQMASTAFHANVGACAQCHSEHLGNSEVRPRMDHRVLARIGAAIGSSSPKPASESVWSAPGAASDVDERRLECATCHGVEDRHAGFFGGRCLECHTTERWSIAAFRHPPADSVECAQCHVAPRSHTMHHFQMVSRVAAHHAEARVEQCYLCHQPTSWNDIRGVGYYDHH